MEKIKEKSKRQSKNELAYKAYKSMYPHGEGSVMCGTVLVQNKSGEYERKQICIKVQDILNIIKKQL